MFDIESPYRRAIDAPSRQLLWELGRLSVNDQEEFQERLNRDAAGRETAHKAALAAAAAEHERVRRDAERERERLEIQIQLERTRRENGEREALERQRREKLESELAERRKEVERARAVEAEERQAKARQADERKAAELRTAQAAAAEKQRVEKEKKEKEATRQAAKAEKKAKEAAEAIEDPEKAQSISNPAPVPQQTKANIVPLATRDPVGGTEHQRYLEIHQRLKKFRQYMSDQGKKNAELKKNMGDMRRTIKKCVSQVTTGQANTAPKAEVIKTLKAALIFAQPQVDITMFLASPPAAGGDTQGPALLVYLLNIFAKAVVSQFLTEAAVSPKAADPVGVIASTIFAANEFRWNGISLIDVLIAKYHVVCPVLFGIYGNDVTNEGKKRLGWVRDDETGSWVSEQRHLERMTGLGAGFAALALRNYNKARLENPYPIYNYWGSLAAIVNVPPQEATFTHFVVLKAMIENNEFRILDFFGKAGMLALRKALVDFPRQAGLKNVAAKAVAVIPDALRREKKLYL